MENVFSGRHGWLPSYLGPKAWISLVRLPRFECSSYTLLAHPENPVLSEDSLSTDWLLGLGLFFPLGTLPFWLFILLCSGLHWWAGHNFSLCCLAITIHKNEIPSLKLYELWNYISILSSYFFFKKKYMRCANFVLLTVIQPLLLVFHFHIFVIFF